MGSSGLMIRVVYLLPILLSSFCHLLYHNNHVIAIVRLKRSGKNVVTERTRWRACGSGRSTLNLKKKS